MCIEADLLPSTLQRSLGVCVGMEVDAAELTGISYCKQDRVCLCVNKDMSRVGGYVLRRRSCMTPKMGSYQLGGATVQILKKDVRVLSTPHSQPQESSLE